MHGGKTLFAQVMEFVPWTSFARIVHRYSGNVGARTLSCAEQFRAMAFAQLTWRESLRDIEVSLSANATKLYAMGFRSAVKRSTLADANESRDCRYLDFARLYTPHQAGAFFVTRAKSPMDARRVYSASTVRTTGVLCDQRVMLNGHYSAKKYPEYLRRIRFKDPESGKTLVFLTNNTALPALTICALYKSRWQVELFFKWIKQHLRIKHFLGNSENAVKPQVWCAVAAYVLIAIAKKQLHLDASLYTLLQIISVTIFEKMPLQQALTENTHPSINLVNPNQLNLLGV
jgi:hypothetical protein